MVHVYVCTEADGLYERLRALCDRSGWQTVRGGLQPQDREYLASCGTNAVLIDLRGDPEDTQGRMAFVRQTFPCLPVILVADEAPRAPGGANPVYHLNPNRLDDLEHILLSLLCASGPGGLAAAQDASQSGVLPRVLVIDDDEKLAGVISSYLREQKHLDVRTANTGFQAGAILGDFRPDVVVVDLALGDMDGREICTFIRNRDGLEGTKVVGVSGYVPSELALMAASFDAYLEKPFSMKDLAEEVFALLDHPPAGVQ